MEVILSLGKGVIVRLLRRDMRRTKSPALEDRRKAKPEPEHADGASPERLDRKRRPQ